MTTHTDSFRNYIKDPANFNQAQGNNYDLIFPIWFTETQFDQTVSVKASPAAQYENDSYHRGKNTIYFELDYPGTEIASCRMVVNCDNAVRVLQQSDGETTGYSQGNGRLLLTNAGMANTETGHFTLKNGKNRFIFEVANHGDPQGGPSYLLACAVTSDPTNNLIFHTGYNFCRWGGYTAATNPTYDSLGQGWKWKNGFFTNTDAPVLSGVPGNVTIKDNESYTIPTVTATDTTDGTLSVTVINGGFTTSGSSSHTIGNYTITFTTTDSNAVTTTASYVLTVEASGPPEFPMNMSVEQVAAFVGYYKGSANQLHMRISIHNGTYDPNNTSIRDGQTGEIGNSTWYMANTTSSTPQWGPLFRNVWTPNNGPGSNALYLKFEWRMKITHRMSEAGRWLYLEELSSHSNAGGMQKVDWTTGNNYQPYWIYVYRVYYLTTSGRTSSHVTGVGSVYDENSY